MRNRAFANHTTMTNATKNRPKPLYYFTSSNGAQACNPNSLRDMGATRNAEYKIGDQMDQIKNVTWMDLMRGDEELARMTRSSSTQQNWRRASVGSLSRHSNSHNEFRQTKNLLNRDELLQQCNEQGEREAVPGSLLGPKPAGLKRDYPVKKNQSGPAPP